MSRSKLIFFSFCLYFKIFFRVKKCGIFYSFIVDRIPISILGSLLEPKDNVKLF